MLNWNRSFPYDDEEGCITHVWALLDYPAARAFDRKTTLIEVAQEFMSCPQDSKIHSLSIDRMGGISLTIVDEYKYNIILTWDRIPPYDSYRLLATFQGSVYTEKILERLIQLGWDPQITH